MLAVLAALIRDLVFGTPTDGQVPKWVTANSRAEWATFPGPDLSGYAPKNDPIFTGTVRAANGQHFLLRSDSANGFVIDLNSILKIGNNSASMVGNAFMMNDGGGTGGGQFLCDGGDIRACNNMDAQSYFVASVPGGSADVLIDGVGTLRFVNGIFMGLLA